MDFTNRGAQNTPVAKSNNGNAGTSNTNGGGIQQSLKKLARSSQEPSWVRIMTVILLFSLTVLAVMVSMLFYFGNPHESKFLDGKRVQAVFLTNGQVYFGNIKETSSKFVDLENIYYLNTQQAQPDQNNKDSNNQTTNFSLVKLGCELHGPYDRMVINRDQVVFWENLRDDGKVSQAIQKWVEQNPNGQKCQETTNSTQQSTSNNNTSNNSNTNNTSNNGTNGNKQ